jgi:hypothetical protein
VSSPAARSGRSPRARLWGRPQARSPPGTGGRAPASWGIYSGEGGIGLPPPCSARPSGCALPASPKFRARGRSGRCARNGGRPSLSGARKRRRCSVNDGATRTSPVPGACLTRVSPSDELDHPPVSIALGPLGGVLRRRRRCLGRRRRFGRSSGVRGDDARRLLTRASDSDHQERAHR